MASDNMNADGNNCPSINIRLSPITGLEVQMNMPAEQAYFVLHMIAERIMLQSMGPPPGPPPGLHVPGRR